VRRIGVLMPYDENDPESTRRVSTFTQALVDLGWTDGRKVRVDLRFGIDTNRMRALAQELVGLQPDVILTGGTPATAALQRETQTIPIVFVTAVDPVASGIVPRLDRPSGNFTGFALLEPTLGGKSQIEAVIEGQDTSGTIEARDIRNSTHQELVRNAGSYRRDLEIAKKTEAELEKQLSAIVAQTESRVDRLFCARAPDVGLRLRRSPKRWCR
jgi:hypothetical protein